MEPAALVLLTALLCAGAAQGLRCYTCFLALDNSDSFCPPATCSYPDGVCVSLQVESTLESGKVRVKNKLCLPVCPLDHSIPGDMQIMGITTSMNTTCCKTDLCNAGALLGAGAWALVGGLLLSLGWGLWVLL